VSNQLKYEAIKNVADEFRAIEDIVPGMEVYTVWMDWQLVTATGDIEDGQMTWLMFEDGTLTEDRNGEVYEVRWSTAKGA
jgi:hypothetical protein